VHTLIAAVSMAVASFHFSPEVFWPYFNSVVLILLGLFATREEVSRAHGLDKIVALGRVCYAAPLAVFAGEHFASARAIMQMVPKYMPARLFWAYFVGVCLVAASLSIVLNIQAQWSGILLGVMFILFVLMLSIPVDVSNPTRDRFQWILTVREPSFACGAFALAATSMAASRARVSHALVTLARIVISLVVIFYGVEHFLHPDHVPVVPLEMLIPAWIPAHGVISYVTGAALIAAGATMLFWRKNARRAATYLGTLILLVILLVYLPILIASSSAAGAGEKIEALNYFMDTLFFGGTVLVLANALPKDSPAG
jgi:uncharacterized membrane protein